LVEMATEELMKSLTESMILGVSKEVKPESEPATVGLRPAMEAPSSESNGPLPASPWRWPQRS
jgi:hypothetical protein